VNWLARAPERREVKIFCLLPADFTCYRGFINSWSFSASTHAPKAKVHRWFDSRTPSARKSRPGDSRTRAHDDHEEAHYVHIEKTYPLTICSLTKKVREAFDDYVSKMRAVSTHPGSNRNNW
jgi:hypothetical protein